MHHTSLISSIREQGQWRCMPGWSTQKRQAPRLPIAPLPLPPPPPTSKWVGSVTRLRHCRDTGLRSLPSPCAEGAVAQNRAAWLKTRHSWAGRWSRAAKVGLPSLRVVCSSTAVHRASDIVLVTLPSTAFETANAQCTSRLSGLFRAVPRSSLHSLAPPPPPPRP